MEKTCDSCAHHAGDGPMVECFLNPPVMLVVGQREDPLRRVVQPMIQPVNTMTMAKNRCSHWQQEATRILS